MTFDAKTLDSVFRLRLRKQFRSDWFDGLQKAAPPGSSITAMTNILNHWTVLNAALLEEELRNGFAAIRNTLWHGGPLADFQTPFPPFKAPDSKAYCFKGFTLTLTSACHGPFPCYGSFDVKSLQELMQRTAIDVSVVIHSRVGHIELQSGFAESPATRDFSADQEAWSCWLMAPDEQINWADIHGFEIQLRLRDSDLCSSEALISVIEVMTTESSRYGSKCVVARLAFSRGHVLLNKFQPTTSMFLLANPASARPDRYPFYAELDLQNRLKSIELCEHILANKEYYCRAVTLQRCDMRTVSIFDRKQVQDALRNWFD